MPRKTGPIRRVRNIRNVDLSAVPLPYPVLWTPVVTNFVGDVVTYGFVEQSTNTTIQAPGVQDLDPSAWQTFSGLIVVSWVQSGAGNLTLAVTYETGVLLPGDGIYIPAWTPTNRGPNGEWIAPGILVLP